ncbi:hypothetical protein [Gordonia humi]|uniref:Uncharacterized protein n=1 Tax=Gordonia humi TaxID=686429 RepID=A0A840F465_9ACTN|nr:hypothetical protein [Gordonia humi]MBB4134367.1 hypothetical protein [Gordonia humi]
MTRSIRTRVLVAACATAAAVGTGLAPAAQAAPPPATSTVTFHIPAVGGLEIGPGGVPGGSFQRTVVTARPGIRPMIHPAPPATVEFDVRNIAPYHYQYNYRYLSVNWRNLRTGKTGHVRLRHWDLPKTLRADDPTYPATLSTSAVATTGGGPVVASVSVMRTQWKAPSTVISVIPGATALDVPQ